MKNEIIEKINDIINRPSLEESHVQHLFTLSRKLIEKIPEVERKEFSLLKFYCDWTLHSKIDNSKEGALIIEKVHNTILSYLSVGSGDGINSDLNSTLSFSKLRDQLNKLIMKFNSGSDAISLKKWNEIMLILVEIISHCPLEISKKPRFYKILKAIQVHPLKGTSGVERLSIIKIPKTTFDKTAIPEEITFNLLIETTDTTKFLVPIMEIA